MCYLGMNAVIDCIFAIAAEPVNAALFNYAARNFRQMITSIFGISLRKLNKYLQYFFRSRMNQRAALQGAILPLLWLGYAINQSGAHYAN